MRGRRMGGRRRERERDERERETERETEKENSVGITRMYSLFLYVLF